MEATSAFLGINYFAVFQQIQIEYILRIMYLKYLAQCLFSICSRYVKHRIIIILIANMA